MKCSQRPVFMQARDAVPGSDIKNTLVISSKQLLKILCFYQLLILHRNADKHWHKHWIRNDVSSPPSSKNPCCYKRLSDGVILK